jgi:6-phosphogluconolactonase
MDGIRWHSFPDAQSLAGEAARDILATARQATQQRGVFRLVLAGGSTPREIYRLLAVSETDWSRWHLYLGDERCLPPDDGERNSSMIRQEWLDRVAVPAPQNHWIPAELGADQAARAYAAVVAEALPFDLVLLGMGEDGHTASLFPGQQHDPARLVVPVSDAPKPPPARVSLNYATLGRSRKVLLLVTGAAKRDALHAWRQGAQLPVARLSCEAGIDVMMDAAAAG